MTTRRGRPRHADILTPREWQVLALLRDGLTNEQIANRLGISESGAKFHVSEILGKLGVSSRAEAAAWTPRGERRWSLMGALAIPTPQLSFHLTAKAAAVSGAAALAIALLVARGPSPSFVWQELDVSSLFGEDAAPALQPAFVAASPTPAPAFITSTNISVATWGPAEQTVDFHVLRPGYVPAGLRLETISMHYFPGPSGREVPLPTTRNGIIFARYVSDEGYVSFEQGWGMGLPSEPIPATVPHGEAIAGEYTLTWIQGREPGGVGPPNSTRPDAAYFRLGWRPDPTGATGPGWKLTSDFLSLDELRLIAASLY